MNDMKRALEKGNFKVAESDKKETYTLHYPSEYLKNGYFNGNNVIKPELLLGLAKSMADILKTDEQGKRNSHIAKSQLRKFYDFVCDTEQDLTHKVIDERTAISEIVRLDSWANESVSKGKATREFYRFIHDNVNAVVKADTAEAVTAFKKHFEAIICYYPER